MSIVEILVVVVIAAILVAAIGNPVTGARRSGQKRQAVEAARSMAEAVDRFRLDHGERPPALGDAQDWPNAVRGPRNELTGKRYLKTDIDGLGATWLKLGTTVDTSARWNLVYRATTTPPHGFRIDVIYRGVNERPSCTMAYDAAPAPTLSGLAKC